MCRRMHPGSSCPLHHGHKPRLNPWNCGLRHPHIFDHRRWVTSASSTAPRYRLSQLCFSSHVTAEEPFAPRESSHHGCRAGIPPALPSFLNHSLQNKPCIPLQDKPRIISAPADHTASRMNMLSHSWFRAISEGSHLPGNPRCTFINKLRTLFRASNVDIPVRSAAIAELVLASASHVVAAF